MILNVFKNWSENKESWKRYSLIPSKGLQNLAISYFKYQRAKRHLNGVDMTNFSEKLQKSPSGKRLRLQAAVSWDADKFWLWVLTKSILLSKKNFKIKRLRTTILRRWTSNIILAGKKSFEKDV